MRVRMTLGSPGGRITITRLVRFSRGPFTGFQQLPTRVKAVRLK